MATAAATAEILLSRLRPDRDNWFIASVVEDWWNAYVEAGNLHLDFALPNSRFRASWAGQCAKQVAYQVHGVEPTNPITVADAWRFNIGKMLHEHIQDVVQRRFPGSLVEVKVKLGEHGSGHMDVLVKRQDGSVERTISVELKTINGFGFKKAVQKEGPRVTAVMQGAINAYSMDPRPDEMMIAYFSLEVVSPNEFRRMSGLNSEYNRFAAQWTYSKDEYSVIAKQELERLERIVRTVDKVGPAGVPRIVPDPRLGPHLVTNPAKNVLEITQGRDRGREDFCWHCSYCPFKAKCVEDLEESTRTLADDEVA